MANHEQCPSCGHNYFSGGSGLCHWCVDELEEKKQERKPHDYDNPNHLYNSRDDIRNDMSETERVKTGRLSRDKWEAKLRAEGKWIDYPKKK